MSQTQQAKEIKQITAVQLLDCLRWTMNQSGMNYNNRVPGQNDSFCDNIDRCRRLIRQADDELKGA